MRVLLLIFLSLLFTAEILAQAATCKNLVFEGAGIRGIAYAGVIKELENRDLVADIEKVGGTSAGAMTALMLALGYTSDEVFEVISETDFDQLNDGQYGFVGGIHRMRNQYGWYKGDQLLQLIEVIIEKKTGSRETTFADLSSSGYKDLYVTATCLNRQELLLFSAQSYPQMKLKDALRISMSVPLYYEAILIDAQGQVYEEPDPEKQLDHVVDGGILGNFPIHIFDELATDSLCNEYRIANPNTIGVRIDSDDQITKDAGNEGLANMEIEDFADYMRAFYVLVLETMNRNTLTLQDWERTISVSSIGIGPKVKALDQSQKVGLVDSGRNAAASFFESK